MKLLVTLLLAAVGIVHLVPASGLFGNDALAKLYGIVITTPDLEILMRHRAVLFGVVGGLLLAAAFIPRLQATAIVVGLISVASFIWLTIVVGDASPALERIVHVDIVALAALLVAGACLVHWSTSA